jgi:hypothetical protein
MPCVGDRRVIAYFLRCASGTIHRFVVALNGLWFRTEVVWWGFLGFGPWFCCAPQFYEKSKGDKRIERG